MTRQYTFWVGLVASASLLGAFAYLFLPIDEIDEVVASAEFYFLAPGLALYFLSVYARSTRWRYILRPLIGRPRRALYPVVVVGYMANNILPVRLGEVVRSYYASLREPVSPAAAFGTVALERASDVVALLFFVAAVWVFVPTADLLDRLGDQVPGGVPVLVTVSLVPFIGVMAVLLVVSVMSQRSVLRLANRVLSPLPARIHRPLLKLIASLITGLTVLRSPRALFGVLVLSLPVWLLEAGMYLLIGLGFDVHHLLGSTGELIAAVLLFTAISNLAGVVPSVSGGVGPFEFFGAATLVAVGLPEGVAGTYAVTVHIALLVPVTILGGVLLLLDGTSFRSLLRGSRASEPEGSPLSSEGAPEPTL